MSTRAQVVSCALFAAWLAACAQMAGEGRSGVQRMYVFDCGENQTNDLSRWSPGFNVGKYFEFSDQCYLIRHAKGLTLWDSGLSDSIASTPGGVVRGGGAIRSIVRKTLASQLAEIGVKPEDVTHIAFSHTHGDHVGNANYFTKATLYMQEPEYAAAFGASPSKFGFDPSTYEKLRANPDMKLNGDYDVFGDSSVMILSTPGHTPGQQFQQGAERTVDGEGRRAPRGEQGAALDQPRQGAERGHPQVAEVRRVRDPNPAKGAH